MIFLGIRIRLFWVLHEICDVKHSPSQEHCVANSHFVHEIAISCQIKECRPVFNNFKLLRGFSSEKDDIFIVHFVEKFRICSLSLLVISEPELPGSEMTFSGFRSGSGLKFRIRPYPEPQHWFLHIFFYSWVIFAVNIVASASVPSLVYNSCCC